MSVSQRLRQAGPQLGLAILALCVVTVQSLDISSCCTKIEVKSTGQAVDHQSNRMGTYSINGVLSDRPIYKHDTKAEYLFYLTSRSKGLWMVGPKPAQFNGGLAHRGDALCVEDVLAGEWKYTDGTAWHMDDQLTVSCMDEEVNLECTYNDGVEIVGGDLPEPFGGGGIETSMNSSANCIEECEKRAGCKYWTWVQRAGINCYLKMDRKETVRRPKHVSGSIPSACVQANVLSKSPRVEVGNEVVQEEEHFNEREIIAKFKIMMKFDDALYDNETKEFQDLSNTIENDLMDMLKNEKDLSEQADFTVSVTSFEPGSVVCNFKVNYVLKEAYLAIPFTIKPANISETLHKNFKFKKGILFQRFLIASGSFNSTNPIDHCASKGCSHKCDYDYDIEDYRCTCPPTLVLDDDNLTCLTEEEAVMKNEIAAAGTGLPVTEGSVSETTADSSTDKEENEDYDAEGFGAKIGGSGETTTAAVDAEDQGTTMSPEDMLEEETDGNLTEEPATQEEEEDAGVQVVTAQSPEDYTTESGAALDDDTDLTTEGAATGENDLTTYSTAGGEDEEVDSDATTLSPTEGEERKIDVGSEAATTEQPTDDTETTDGGTEEPGVESATELTGQDDLTESPADDATTQAGAVGLGEESTTLQEDSAEDGVTESAIETQTTNAGDEDDAEEPNGEDVTEKLDVQPRIIEKGEGVTTEMGEDQSTLSPDTDVGEDGEATESIEAVTDSVSNEAAIGGEEATTSGPSAETTDSAVLDDDVESTESTDVEATTTGTEGDVEASELGETNEMTTEFPSTDAIDMAETTEIISALDDDVAEDGTESNEDELVAATTTGEGITTGETDVETSTMRGGDDEINTDSPSTEEIGVEETTDGELLDDDAEGDGTESTGTEATTDSAAGVTMAQSEDAEATTTSLVGEYDNTTENPATEEIDLTDTTDGPVLKEAGEVDGTDSPVDENLAQPTTTAAEDIDLTETTDSPALDDDTESTTLVDTDMLKGEEKIFYPLTEDDMLATTEKSEDDTAETTTALVSEFEDDKTETPDSLSQTKEDSNEIDSMITDTPRSFPDETTVNESTESGETAATEMAAIGEAAVEQATEVGQQEETTAAAETGTEAGEEGEDADEAEDAEAGEEGEDADEAEQGEGEEGEESTTVAGGDNLSRSGLDSATETAVEDDEETTGATDGSMAGDDTTTAAVPADDDTTDEPLASEAAPAVGQVEGDESSAAVETTTTAALDDDVDDAGDDTVTESAAQVEEGEEGFTTDVTMHVLSTTVSVLSVTDTDDESVTLVTTVRPDGMLLDDDTDDGGESSTGEPTTDEPLTDETTTSSTNDETTTEGGVHEFDCVEVGQDKMATGEDQIPMECSQVGEPEQRHIFIVINKNQVDPARLFAKNVKVVVKDFMIMDISPQE